MQRVVSGAARFPAPVVLVALIGGSAIVRFWAARGVPAPWITPDEQTYALIGTSLYRSGRFEILGHGAGLLSLVYPALIGLPFRFLGTHTAYLTVKALQAIVMSLTAVPVYMWGRTLMAKRWALCAAALSLAVPGLAYTGLLMTEVVFYPVVTLSAWTMARALAEPSLGNQSLLLGTMLLAVATRLQAIVLVPVLALALVLKLAFGREPLGSIRRFIPLFAGVVAVAGAWVALTTVTEQSSGRVLGSYQVTGTTSYHLLTVLRFGLYHLADLVLLTALLPVVALTVLAVHAAAGQERSDAGRAFVAVAVAYILGFLGEVSLFTSSLLGRLGERYLFGVTPLLFLGLALWLDRGAPRPRLVTAVASLGAVGLLLYLPVRFISERAAPDAFTTIPLYELRRHAGDPQLRIGLVLAAVALLVAAGLLPGRRVWLVPLAVLGLLVPASVSASRFVAHQARGFRLLTVGGDARWIDRAADGPVAFVYAGEYGFSAGGPVWANLFWNRRIEAVYILGRPEVVGPIPKQRLRVAGDGRLLADGAPVQAGLAVGATSLTFFGTPVSRGASYVLWRLERPARLSTRVRGMRLLSGDIDFGAHMDVWTCGAGTLELRLVAPEARRITLSRNGRLYATIDLAPGREWSGRIPAPRGSGGGVCTFDLATYGGGVHADRFEFVRSP